MVKIHLLLLSQQTFCGYKINAEMLIPFNYKSNKKTKITQIKPILTIVVGRQFFQQHVTLLSVKNNVFTYFKSIFDCRIKIIENLFSSSTYYTCPKNLHNPNKYKCISWGLIRDNPYFTR